MANRVTVLLLCCGASALTFCSNSGPSRTVGGRAPNTLAASVVFARPGREGVEVVVRELQSRKSRVVFSSRSQGGVPDDFGFLPSPNGKWLLLWDYLFWHSGGERGADLTRWLLIHVPDGRARELGRTRGSPWLLPHWKDSQHVLLEGESGSVSFDVKAVTDEWPFSSTRDPQTYNNWGERAQARLLGYARRYYPNERKILAEKPSRCSARNWGSRVTISATMGG